MMQTSAQNHKKEQVREEKYKNLGKHPVQSSSVNPIKTVSVDLRTANGHKTLLVSDAFSNFADEHFDVNNQLVLPPSFSYNKHGPKAVQGFPDEKVEGLDSNWYTQAGGNKSEEKVYDTLNLSLESPSLIINGLEVRDMLKVLKVNIQEDSDSIMANNQQLLGHEVTQDEWALAAMLNINKAKVLMDVDEAFNIFCRNLTDPVPDFNSIDANYSTASEADKKKHKGLFSSLKEKIEKLLLNHKKMPSQKEIRDYITRKFYKLELDKNQEFDFLSSQKVTKTIIHIEVKSYPQKGTINPKGLKKVFTEACEQINRGKDFIDNIVAPSTELTKEWTRVSLVWFPEIPNKNPFENLNIKRDSLKYILTGEDIGSDQWWTSLGLAPVGLDDGSYKRLFSFLVGSAHLSVDSQIYDWSQNRREVNEKLVGATGFGLGGEKLPADQPTAKNIKGKHLGHSWNIIFWNPDQKDLKKRKGHNALVGDYGGGKSSLLVSMGMSEAEDLANRVVFISAAAIDPMSGKTTVFYPIFDEALDLKFQGTAVQVFSVHKLIKRYGLPLNSRFCVIMEKFLHEFGGSDNLVVMLDEASVTETDLKQIARQRESELSKLCNMLAAKSKTSWIALSSSALLESDSINGSVELIISPLIRFSNFLSSWIGGASASNVDTPKLQDYFTTHTQHTIAPLTKTMRNTNKIVGGAENVANLVTYNLFSKTPREVILPGAPHTVPGEQPDLILCNLVTIVGNPIWLNLEASMEFVMTDLLKLAHHKQGQLVFPPIKERLVVLCDTRWKPGDVAERLKKLTGWGDDIIHWYDSALKGSTWSNSFIEDTDCPVALDDQRKKVQSFLTSSTGVLVTYNQLFTGMENATIIYITQSLVGAGGAGAVRSAMLRACSKLVVVTDVHWVNKQAAKDKFKVHEIM